ncbi:type II toxin-antitoxin system antitoxin SocA domain-containing protein [Roseateles sp. UC29_93]|uniref:type II toxin-antitoxin system antitoxin SocA domain-containing protein n=1 Tax=Roseateles sp. UC29_93 TaxID=3350177 RepID=UPI003673355A
MYSTFCVANAFIGRALDGRLRDLNSMKLQKLMFFAQAWRLEKKGIPLFQDTFLHGATGPALPFSVLAAFLGVIRGLFPGKDERAPAPP